jgi:hypothetical protein
MAIEAERMMTDKPTVDRCGLPMEMVYAHFG